MSVFFLILCAITPLVASYLVAPPGTPYPEASEDCSGWVEGTTSLTCAEVEEAYYITAADLQSWNLLITATGSCLLEPGFYYCVQVDNNSTVPSMSSSAPTITTMPSTTSVTTTTSGNGISTPSPYQTGMASNCDKFYLVASGDQCDTIAMNEGISLADFYAWNPAVGTSCQYLDLNDYVCVDVIGVTPSFTVTTITSTAVPSNGIPTPTPYQTGMTSNCDSFYLVNSGDQCAALATAYNISLAQFYSWNPAVGSSCEYLDLGDYVCVGVETCTSASVLAGRPQGQLICGAPGASHDNSGSLLITSYTAGSPYVESAAACGSQCLATSSCTNLYFLEGSYCNLHQGASTFAESTVAPFYFWYDVSCFLSGNACGSYGFSNDNPSTVIISYTSGSPYVESAAACGAQCLSTSGCTNVYFTQSSYCNLHSPSSFNASTESGYYSWYQSSCFACNALSV